MRARSPENLLEYDEGGSPNTKLTEARPLEGGSPKQSGNQAPGVDSVAVIGESRMNEAAESPSKSQEFSAKLQATLAALKVCSSCQTAATAI